MVDGGIYDLLLHKRDVCYSTKDLERWIEQGGYDFVDFLAPEQRVNISLRNKISELKLHRKLLKMDMIKQRSIGEVLCGNMITQEAYLSKRPSSFIF